MIFQTIAKETPPNLPLSGEEQESGMILLLPSLIRGGLGWGFFKKIRYRFQLPKPLTAETTQPSQP